MTDLAFVSPNALTSTAWHCGPFKRRSSPPECDACASATAPHRRIPQAEAGEEVLYEHLQLSGPYTNRRKRVPNT